MYAVGQQMVSAPLLYDWSKCKGVIEQSRASWLQAARLMEGQLPLQSLHTLTIVWKEGAMCDECSQGER